MRIAKTISQLLVTIAGIVLCSAAMLVLTAQHSTVDSVRAVDAVAYHGMFNPGATLDTTQVDDTRGVRDTAWEDAEAEGRDVLVLHYGEGPNALWNALIAQHPGWYDEPMDGTAAPGEGAFYVPTGTVVDTPGGLYLATLDGWFTCHDFRTSDQECSATGPVVPVDMPEVAPVQTVAHTAALPAPAPHRFTAQERKAARLILARLKAHRHVEEDWTWQGMPRVVGVHNDALSRAAQAAGLHGNKWPWSSRARTWLSQVVRTGKAGPAQSPQKA